MKKGFSFTLIAMLIVLSVVLGVLYLSNNQEKSRKIEALTAELDDRDRMIQDLNEDTAGLSSVSLFDFLFARVP